MICGLGGLISCQENLVEPAYYGTVTGTVRDGRTNLPLANTSVTTNPATSSYLTDAAGKFRIENAPAGRFAVTVSKVDYQQVVTNVTVNDGQTADVSIVLTKSSTAAPTAPNRPTPANQATAQPTTVLLSWRPVGATASDSLRYDVALFESNNLNQRMLLTNSKDTAVTATSLRYSTTYYWQVTVRNTAGVTARGPIWSFQTVAFPTNRYLFARTVVGNTDIYSADGTATPVQLTFGSTVETAPQLSPTRDLIAYTSNATGLYQLYTMNHDGSNPRQITTLDVDGYNNRGVGYRWSPDGAYFIYAHNDKLYRINRDGTGRMELATAPAGRNFRECDWTAEDGGHLVVQTVGADIFDSELYIYNTDGTNPRLLVSNLPGRVDSPSFSIDGLTVVYTRDVTGFNSAAGRQQDARIFSRRTDGTGTPVDLSSGTNNSGKTLGTNDLTPHFAPDGFHLIFVNRTTDEVAPPEVWTADLDGRNRTRLFTNAFLPDYK
ncbi:carboxypeptidase regulatory-like domain-containing protein [Hymenobacter artigasi]|uniref:carboxypeptidase regulatory-like domain-containing protein n=1 Tax=Hymenobacter artigasi TaxID=2719616 RepID=UPI001F1ED424|nr:carboxypeptidase regulatory-like domain-containing protein [Hymenobacter artigasi]